MIRWLSSLWRRSPPASAPPSTPVATAGTFIEAEDEKGWRPVSQSKRDLTPVTQRRMQELAHHAWEQHRVANRLI